MRANGNKRITHMKNISYLFVILSMTINIDNATGIGSPEGLWALFFP